MVADRDDFEKMGFKHSHHRDVDGRYNADSTDIETNGWTLLQQDPAELSTPLTLKFANNYTGLVGSSIHAAVYRDGLDVQHYIEIQMPGMRGIYQAYIDETGVTSLGDLNGALKHLPLTRHLIEGSREMTSGDRRLFLGLVDKVLMAEDTEES